LPRQGLFNENGRKQSDQHWGHEYNDINVRKRHFMKAIILANPDPTRRRERKISPLIRFGTRTRTRLWVVIIKKIVNTPDMLEKNNICQ